LKNHFSSLAVAVRREGEREEEEKRRRGGKRKPNER